MCYPKFVRVLKPAKNVAHYVNEHALSYFDLLDVVEEVRPLYNLSHHVYMVGILMIVLKIHYVFVVAAYL